MIEYQVRPITRYVITRYTNDGNGRAGVETKGEYDNHRIAHEVAYALCKAEHGASGEPLDSGNFQYPKQVTSNPWDDVTSQQA